MILPSTMRGRYRLETCLAANQTYNLVFRGIDTFNGVAVAIKQTKRDGLSPQQRRFADWLLRREASLLTGLYHTGLPHLRDMFEEQGMRHLVMDFIEGETLQQRLDRPGHRLTFRECLGIGCRLCEILTYLHSQSPPIIHRDLKPANIMLTSEGRLFLIDFGIARQFTQGAVPQVLVAPNYRQVRRLDTVYNVGSCGYAPREQYGENTSTSPRADIYSLGALLHYLLSGIDPAKKPVEQLFTFTPLSLVFLPGGDSITSLIRQMLDGEPMRRPTLEVVWETLEACRAQLAGYTSPWLPAGGHAATTSQLVLQAPLSSL